MSRSAYEYRVEVKYFSLVVVVVVWCLRGGGEGERGRVACLSWDSNLVPPTPPPCWCSSIFGRIMIASPFVSGAGSVCGRTDVRKVEVIASKQRSSHRVQFGQHGKMKNGGSALTDEGSHVFSELDRTYHI